MPGRGVAEKHVECRIPQQTESQAEAVPGGAAAASTRRDHPDLARADRQPPGVEVRAEVQSHGSVAEPAGDDDLALGLGRLQRELETLFGTARLDHDVSFEPRLLGVRVLDAEPLADSGLGAIDVYQHDVDARDLAGEAGD